MKTRFLPIVCLAALIGFSGAARATSEIATEPQVEEAVQTAPADHHTTTDTPKKAPPVSVEDNAMTKVQGKQDAKADAAKQETPAPEPAAAAISAPEGEAHSHETPDVPDVDWSFDGPLGTFDRPALQRGFQVYKQVCAACHSLGRVYYRNLHALGYNDAEIKALSAEASVMDGPNDEGEMYERPGRPSDAFKAPFANDQAARYANGGALPPDLSLIVRARANGANYVHGILTGYAQAPADFAVNPGMHYNQYFPGHQIAMPAPLSEGVVSYEDGTAASVDQMAKDVTTFLAWASEPVMEQRKQTGFKVLIFLAVFSVLMYLSKRKLWKDIH